MSIPRATPEDYFEQKPKEDTVNAFIRQAQLQKFQLPQISDRFVLIVLGIAFLAFVALLAYLKSGSNARG